MGRNAEVNDGIIKYRREYAVKLKRAGFSMGTILRKINGLESKKHWGIIEMRQLKRDIASSFAGIDLNDPGERLYLTALRDLHMQDMEGLMETLSEKLRLKKDWKSGEKEKTIKTLFTMKTQYAELQGWNYSKKSVVDKMTQPSRLEIYREGAKQIMNSPSDRLAIVRLCDELIMKTNEKSEDEPPPQT